MFTETQITTTLPAIPVLALNAECQALRTAYKACKDNGDDAGAMRVYTALHEIEDGY